MSCGFIMTIVWDTSQLWYLMWLLRSIQAAKPACHGIWQRWCHGGHFVIQPNYLQQKQNGWDTDLKQDGVKCQGQAWGKIPTGFFFFFLIWQRLVTSHFLLDVVNLLRTAVWSDTNDTLPKPELVQKNGLIKTV